MRRDWSGIRLVQCGLIALQRSRDLAVLHVRIAQYVQQLAGVRVGGLGHGLQVCKHRLQQLGGFHQCRINWQRCGLVSAMQ